MPHRNLDKRHLLGEMTRPEAEKKFREVDVAILPVGAIEQHARICRWIRIHSMRIISPKKWRKIAAIPNRLCSR
ncbi:MAG: hypothetical protein R3C26_10860 [Calditrichia bacterium]